jgi:hypothetical protein
MPFKDKTQIKEYKHSYYQRLKEMTSQQVPIFLRDVKKNFQRGVSANTTASELLEDFGKVYNTTSVECKLEKLQRELIPNEPTDEIETRYLTMSKSDRQSERQRLIQKLEFLNRMDANDDIRGNRFIDDVIMAMDAKAKAKEAEEANMRSRQRLGKSSVSTGLMEPKTKAPEPEPKDPLPTSMWNSFFGGSGGGGSSSSSLKRSRSR